MPLLFGCEGGIDDDADDYMGLASLPPPPSGRHLIFNDGSTLSYRVDVMIGSRDMHECLEPDDYDQDMYSREQAFEAMDDALRQHAATEYRDAVDLTAIEAELALALHGACGYSGQSWSEVLSLDLVIYALELVEPLPA